MRKRNVKMLARRHVINVAAMDNVIHNSKPAPPAEVSRVMVHVRMAYEHLKTGDGQQHDYQIVIHAVNVGMVRAEAISPHLVSYFLAGGEAMLESARLHTTHGRYGFTGPGILAMNAALEFYEQMLQLSSPNQMHDAAIEVERRERDGHVITTP